MSYIQAYYLRLDLLPGGPSCIIEMTNAIETFVLFKSHIFIYDVSHKILIHVIFRIISFVTGITSTIKRTINLRLILVLLAVINK